MTEHLCLAANCRGRHEPGCTDRTCRGCAPSLAADGLALCRFHADRIGQDAEAAAKLDAELLLALTPAGEPGVRGDHGGLSLNDAAAKARADLRAVLSSWCRMVAEERGMQLPGAYRFVLVLLPDGVEGPVNRVREFILNDSVHGMAAYIATHGEWLAAHGAAADASAEMGDLLRACRAAAYPSGTRIIKIGPCPALDDDELPCLGTVRALLRRVDSLLPSALACDTVEAHSWAPDQWRALGRHMGQRVVAVGGEMMAA